ncbi:hypothetical protein IWQ56_007392, partial [Coemansia nantahalensis]
AGDAGHLGRGLWPVDRVALAAAVRAARGSRLLCRPLHGGAGPVVPRGWHAVLWVRVCRRHWARHWLRDHDRRGHQVVSALARLCVRAGGQRVWGRRRCVQQPERRAPAHLLGAQDVCHPRGGQPRGHVPLRGADAAAAPQVQHSGRGDGDGRPVGARPGASPPAARAAAKDRGQERDRRRPDHHRGRQLGRPHPRHHPGAGVALARLLADVAGVFCQPRIWRRHHLQPRQHDHQHVWRRHPRARHHHRHHRGRLQRQRPPPVRLGVRHRGPPPHLSGRDQRADYHRGVSAGRDPAAHLLAVCRAGLAGDSVLRRRRRRHRRHVGRHVWRAKH